MRGQARYAGDIAAPDVPGGVLDVAVAVTSTQATGQVLAIDPAAALALPGVRLVVTHENAPRLHKVTVLDGAELGDLLPLQDAKLHYNGQCLALVVADTLEHARAAAAAVVVRYAAADPARGLHPGPERCAGQGRGESRQRRNPARCRSATRNRPTSKRPARWI